VPLRNQRFAAGSMKRLAYRIDRTPGNVFHLTKDWDVADPACSNRRSHRVYPISTRTITAQEAAMFLATRIPQLTDQMLKNTLRAADASARGVDWLTIAEIERLEQRLLTLERRLVGRAATSRQAA
jgi:hypothetical protein